MCLKKAVDSTLNLDDLIQVEIPMSHVKTRGYDQAERSDGGSSCWPAAHLPEKEADQAKRNSAEPPKPAKTKAPPPLPHADVQKDIPWDERFGQPTQVKAKAPPPLLHAGVQQTIPLGERVEGTQEKSQTF